MAYAIPNHTVSESNVVQQGSVCKGVVKDAAGETVIGRFSERYNEWYGNGNRW